VEIEPDPVDVLQRLYPPLRRAARTLVGDQDGEDLVQAALVQVLARHPGFAGLDHPLGYAKTVMLRLAYRSWRQRGQVADELVEALDTSSPAQEDAIQRLDLQAAIRRLGPRQRLCVYLHHVEGLPDSQVAALTGIRPSTVRSQLSRAEARLREILGDAA
jgi:RNA polymerase sigma-70 factor (ECF subfamily)